MAPVLSFTAEEAWKGFQPGDSTIFIHTYYGLPELEDQVHLMARWHNLREIRKSVLKRLEDLRTAGEIGSSLQAEVDIHVGPSTFDDLSKLGEDLKFVMITSKAALHRDEAPGRAQDDTEAMKVVAVPSPHKKCERCWHWRADVGADPGHPGICARCVQNLYGSGEPRQFA
jgi:isoleucyl-tRNA synthetase